MKYTKFDSKDFILDESFQKWVLYPDEETDLFWENFIQQHPEKQPEINKAKTAILELYFAGIRKEQSSIKKKPSLKAEPSINDAKAVWENILQGIHAPTSNRTTNISQPTDKVIPIFSFTYWAKMAASILLIITTGTIFWLQQQSATPAEEVTYATSFGETKQLTLPDNSKIFMNANSRLTVAKNWAADTDRKVKLDGEAFFSVVHTKNHRKFTVALVKGAQIEVLGTEFTVTERPSLSRVVLNKGKVKITVLDKKAATGKKEAIMVPGDLAKVNWSAATIFKTHTDNPAMYTGFTQGQLIFNETPLLEVARLLKDNYGYKVKFSPEDLAQKQFTGSSPSNQVDLLFTAIEKAFNLKVIKKGRNISIEKS